MKTTLSIIKADIGSIGGHIRPSQRLLEEVRNYVASKGKGMMISPSSFPMVWEKEAKRSINWPGMPLWPGQKWLKSKDFMGLGKTS